MDTWSDTLSESVVMLMDGFFAVTDVLEPHRLFLPAALPGSGSLAPPSVVPGGVLLPSRGVTRERRCHRWEKMLQGGEDVTRGRICYRERRCYREEKMLQGEDVTRVRRCYGEGRTYRKRRCNGGRRCYGRRCYREGRCYRGEKIDDCCFSKKKKEKKCLD